MSLIFYNILITVLWPFYRMLVLYSEKFSRFHIERIRSIAELEDFLKTIPRARKPLWLHASSVGEFDQALGVLRSVKKHNKKQIIIISVFSMSVKKLSHPEADFVFRLPLDFFPVWPGLIKKINPSAFVTMTWDVFPNLLFHLRRRKVPAFLCSAAMKKTSSRLRFPLLQLYRPVYANFTGIGAADESNRKSLEILYGRRNGLKVTGDSRYDTILYKIKNSKLNLDDRKKLSTCKKNVIIFASTYAADDEAVFPRLNSLFKNRDDWTVLIFPHHVDKKRIQEVMRNAEKYHIAAQLYSSLSSLKKSRVIIVDRLGVLALAYQYADIAYVGGAFHHRIHNTAEPAAFGIPVITGPLISSSPAALALEEKEALLAFATGKKVTEKLEQLISSPALRKKIGLAGKKLVQEQSGSSELFYRTFLKEILNTEASK